LVASIGAGVLMFLAAFIIPAGKRSQSLMRLRFQQIGVWRGNNLETRNCKRLVFFCSF
jgi:hypothetical protein